MSRRANPAVDRAAQNAQTLKALVKLEGNKVCADCKRNKHPRWASWNLGVFVCIRCSGIHRGMGTHISRVKSVDLDAWTDEQLQSVLKWGNVRANKYWEAKLAAGHVPSEAKIENFIRTKYDTKRWVMEGPMPDPATLDADDDVPLNIVQEKAKIERSASQKAGQDQQKPLQPPQSATTANVDLFGDFAVEPPVRPSTVDISATKRMSPASNSNAPQAKPESLLGLDFFGSSQNASIGRPASAASNPVSVTNSRGDLKNSILSLYASTPKPVAPQQAPQATNNRHGSMGRMTMPSTQPQDSFSVLTDAFRDVRFSENQAKSTNMPQSHAAAFSGMSFPSVATTKATPVAPQVTSPPPLSGGSFFDAVTTKPPASKPPSMSSKPAGGLNFSFTENPTISSPAPKPSTVVSMPPDLFGDDGFNDFTSAPAPVSAPKPAPPPSSTTSKTKSPTVPKTPDFASPFNLSAPASTSTMSKPDLSKNGRTVAAPQPTSALFDPWGGSDSNAWGATESAKPAAPKVELGKVPSRLTPNDISGGWGAPISSNNRTASQPTVTADEDFGGWTSAPVQKAQASVNKPSTGFGASDPFDNPWG